MSFSGRNSKSQPAISGEDLTWLPSGYERIPSLCPRDILWLIPHPLTTFWSIRSWSPVGNRTTAGLDHWQKALHILSFRLCVSSSDAQGHGNGQIWGRKSILLQKIVRQGSWEFFPFSSAKSAVCRLEFLIVPGAFRVQILGCVFFAPGAELFHPRAETLSMTVVFGTCRNSNNSLRPIKGHHYPN